MYENFPALLPSPTKEEFGGLTWNLKFSWNKTLEKNPTFSYINSFEINCVLVG